jgi:hypothetical protein
VEVFNKRCGARLKKKNGVQSFGLNVMTLALNLQPNTWHEKVWANNAIW